MAQVLDCSDLLKFDITSPGFRLFSNRLGTELQSNGFAYLINHGIPTNTVDDVFRRSKKFFNLSPEVKLNYKKNDPFTDIFGFVPSGTERAKESTKPVLSSGITKREAFDFDLPETRGVDFLKYPEEIQQWGSQIDKISIKLKKLAKIILKGIGIFLDLDPAVLLAAHQSLDCDLVKAVQDDEQVKVNSATKIRASYYMPLDVPFPKDRQLFRLQTHCDWGSLTFLFQDEHAGLESQRTDGAPWVNVNPVPNSIVLQLGHVMETFSGGRLLAAPHRVRLTESNAYVARQTLAFFVHPDDTARCAALLPKSAGWTSPLGEEGLTHAQSIVRKRQRTTVDQKATELPERNETDKPIQLP